MGVSQSIRTRRGWQLFPVERSPGEVIARRSKVLTMCGLGRKLSVPESGFWHWGRKTRMGLVMNRLIVPNYCCWYLRVLQQHSSAAWGTLLWLVLYYFREEMFLSETLYLKRLGRKEQKRRVNTKQFWKCQPAGLYKCTILLILKYLLMTGAKPTPLIQSNWNSVTIISWLHLCLLSVYFHP